MARIQARFVESDNKRKAFRVYPECKASILIENLGEGIKKKATYVNETSLPPFPSWSFIVDYIEGMMPKGFMSNNPKKGKKDLKKLLTTIWDNEEDLLHITFYPNYIMEWTHKTKGAGQYAPWYHLHSEEKELLNAIKRDSKGRIKKTGKHSY